MEGFKVSAWDHGSLLPSHPLLPTKMTTWWPVLTPGWRLGVVSWRSWTNCLRKLDFSYGSWWPRGSSLHTGSWGGELTPTSLQLPAAVSFCRRTASPSAPLFSVLTQRHTVESISVHAVAEEAGPGFLFLKYEELPRITKEFGWISGMKKKTSKVNCLLEETEMIYREGSVG